MPSLGISLKVDRIFNAVSNFILIFVQSGTTVTNNNVFSGKKGLKIFGGGTVVLGGSNTFSGGLVVNNSSVQFPFSSNLGIGKITLNKGCLITSAVNTIALPIQINGGALRAGASKRLTISSVISGSGDLEFVQDRGEVFLSGANTYSGNTILGSTNYPAYTTGGYNVQLTIGNGAAIPQGSVVTLINNSIFYTNGYTPKIAGLSGTSSTSLVTGNGGLEVSLNGFSYTYQGKITGTLNLIISGSGTQALSAANTYSGTNTLNGGTTSIFNAASLGTGSVTINFGATLNLNGIAIANHITVNPGGTLNKQGAILANSPTNNGGTINP